MSRCAQCLLLLILVLGAQSASAHTRSESYSHWHLADARITATVTIPLREVMVLYETRDPSQPPREMFQQVLQDNTTVFAGDRACRLANSNVLEAAAGFVRVEVAFDCDNATPEGIRYRALFDHAPAHVHYAKLHVGGMLAGEALLTDTADTWNIAGISASESWSFLSFINIGMRHIASGLDHIAFLCGLLLVAGSARRAIIAITGFTLGHSVSLAAAVLGYVGANSQLVEAFIGFTISLVAAEYFLLRHRQIGRFAIVGLAIAWLTGIAAFALGFIDGRALLAYIGFGLFAACYLVATGALEANKPESASRWLFVATCCFGLVHGFGFAGFLMDTGMLGRSLLLPLLGFNLGVELGQLIIVGAILATVTLLRKRIPPLLPQLIAAGLAGIGVFWFVGRTLA